MSTENNKDRRRQSSGTGRNTDRREAPSDERRNAGKRPASGSRTDSRAGRKTPANRSAANSRSREARHPGGRGLTRQQRQKQLLQQALIAVAILVAAVVVVVACIRGVHKPVQEQEGVPSAAAQKTEQTAEEAGKQETDSKEAGTEEKEAGTEEEKETPAAPAVKTQEEEPAETVKTNSVANQSLVEKLSGEARKRAAEEKKRQDEEAAERARIEAEEAKKAEVKSREELSELPLDELTEYLRNKEVPEELLYFMEEYPESREFVTDYLYQPDEPPSKDISAEVTQGEFPHFLQWDERWGYEDYGGSFFAVAGCGPTAMSVVYSGLTGNTDMNPFAMGEWAEEQGFYVIGSGTSWEMMWNGANMLGLASWEVDMDETTILTTLRNGFPIIAAMTAGGDFTNFGHFIVLVGADEDGNITIRDSNSIERTERTWTWDELMWQVAGLWAYNSYF